MNDIQPLDPRVQGFEKKARLIGAGLVTVFAAVVVAVTGGALIVAGVVAVGGIVAVNVVPVISRRLALWKQGSLTKLAEEFSEETIREDERHEAERVVEAERSFTTMKAELEGAIEELRGQRQGASDDEVQVIDNQISTMEGLITDEGNALQQRQVDLKELRRVNGLLIAMDRSARAMQKVKGAERNPEEQQRLVTSRNAIKTRMRAAIAGQQVDAMRRQVNGKFSPLSAAQLGQSQPVTLPVNIEAKEKVDVPNRR